nr:hypothetical protein GCM10020093_072090 [Planobispora longispora]
MRQHLHHPHRLAPRLAADLHSIASRRLERLARELRGLYSVTGKTIRVGFEPWPGCVLETTEQALERVCDIDSEHLGVCLDACHLAGGGEEPGRPCAAWPRRERPWSSSATSTTTWATPARNSPAPARCWRTP